MNTWYTKSPKLDILKYIIIIISIIVTHDIVCIV